MHSFCFFKIVVFISTHEFCGFYPFNFVPSLAGGGVSEELHGVGCWEGLSHDIMSVMVQSFINNRLLFFLPWRTALVPHFSLTCICVNLENNNCSEELTEIQRVACVLWPIETPISVKL